MAIRLRSVPLFGTGIASKSFVSTRQRRLNVYFEIRQDKDKSRFAVYNTPGLELVFKHDIDTSAIRGLLGTPSGLFLVAGSNFEAITSLSPFTRAMPSAGFTTRTGAVCLATNNTQVIIADGSQGMIYNVANNTLLPIGGAFPDTSRTVTFVSSYFVAEEPGTQKFWVSATNDGTSWDGLAFNSAAAYPGTVVAVDNLNGNLIVFSTDHVEFFQNVGAIPEPFAPIQSAATEYGLAAIFSRAHLDETICFLAQNREGLYQIAQITGYNINIISTDDIGHLINSFDVVSDAIGCAYGDDMHKFYQITFPTANRSFLYDSSTDMWSEVQTGPSVVPVRHIANWTTVFQGKILATDYKNNNVYTFNPDMYTDNGQTTVRELITRHTLGDFNRVRIAQLYLDMETGVGLVNGQGSDPQIMLSYSKDNGRTWSGERWTSLGKIGEYNTRVTWRRFGSTRDAVFKIRMTDPVKFVLTDAAMRIREKNANPNRAQAQGRME